MESEARAERTPADAQGELEGLTLEPIEPTEEGISEESSSEGPQEEDSGMETEPDPDIEAPGAVSSGEPSEPVDAATMRVGAALDGLEQRIKLLAERHVALADRCAAAEAASQEATRQLDSLKESGLDPVSLDARVRELEAENESLSRHAGCLEEEIRSLLSRVRYVLEA